MRIREVHELLQKHKGGKVTQNDIARAIETSRANVSKLFTKNSSLNDEKIEKIEKYFDINFNHQKDILTVDYYPDTLAKIENKKLVFSKKHVKVVMPLNLFKVKENQKYIMYHANDNSMSPLIMNDDFAIIEIINEIENNKIHAFMYNDEFYIRRLSKNINQIIVKAENKDFPTQYIEKTDIENFYIIGKIVYIGRTNGL